MSMPMGGGYYQTSPQVSFDWLGKAWELFRQNAAAWVVATLLYGIIAFALMVGVALLTGFYSAYMTLLSGTLSHTTSVPPGFSSGFIAKEVIFLLLFTGIAFMLMGGLYRMALRQIRGEMVGAGDFLAIGDVALPLLVVGIITSFAIIIGSYMCFFPGMIMGGLLMFAPLIVVDKKTGPFPALSESINLLKGQWIMAAVFYFVASMISQLGVIACLVGVLVTVPLFIISIAVGYDSFTKPVRPWPGQPGPDYGQTQPGVWPPPPSMSGGAGQPGALPPDPRGEPGPNAAPQPGGWQSTPQPGPDLRPGAQPPQGQDLRPGEPPNSGESGWRSTEPPNNPPPAEA